MYANYLIEVGKLVFIVGDNQNTTQFKNIFHSSGPGHKQKIFYKCLEQVPLDTFVKDKQVPGQKKGIIKKDWFTKLLNKTPEMIVMIFNCTQQLEGNEVWEDRLKVMIKKINKVFDLMRSNEKEQVRLKIIILISKHSFGGVNLHEKITNFLKYYQKSLFIVQAEYYAKQISKARNQWAYELQKNYDNKYKKIQKRADESFSERKIGCLIKLSILSEMLLKKDPRQKYVETYKILRSRYTELIKSVTILSHYQIRELRAVADAIFLRYVKILMTAGTMVEKIFKLALDHMAFYKSPNLGRNETHKYFYYEELIWRCTFIQNFLEILYSADLIEKMSPNSLCQILNQLIAYHHALSLTSEHLVNSLKSISSENVEQTQQKYIGLISYKANQLFETDIIYCFMRNVLLHKKDYLSKGIQLITRYKTMNMFKQNQLLFLDVYLLRFYFQDSKKLCHFINLDKFKGFITVYDQVMKQQLSKSNYFLLNVIFLEIFNEIKEDFNNITQEQNVMFYGVSCLICDYFQNINELSNHLSHLFSSIQSQLQMQSKPGQNKSIDLLQHEESLQLNDQIQLIEPFRFYLKKKSNIVSVQCFIDEEFVYIQNQFNIRLVIKLHPQLAKMGCEIEIKFNFKENVKKITIPAGSSYIIESIQIIRPLQYFTKDETLKIECIKISPLKFLQFFISHNHILFIKHKQNKIFTNIRCPDISINSQYHVYYFNEISKFQINVERLNGFNIQAKCQIREEDAYGKTQVFVDLDERLNLTNSNYYEQLLVGKDKSVNEFWLKCNKNGEKKLKFYFQIVVQRLIEKNKISNLLQNTSQISESNQKKYILKQTFSLTKQLRFTIQNLFQIRKTFLEFSNNNNRLIQNRNIPVDKNIIAAIQIQSVEDVFIQSIAQHRNPKKITYFKEINKKNFLLKKGNRVKLNLIFKVPIQFKDQIQLYLMSIYIKWTRLESNKMIKQPYLNVFLDQQTKINCYLNSISISLNISNHFQIVKNKPSLFSISIKNHSNNKSHIYIEVEGTSSIWRIGEKAKQLFINGQSQASTEFMIFPVMSGYLAIPNIKVLVDGIERRVAIGTGQVIKCT